MRFLFASIRAPFASIRGPLRVHSRSLLDRHADRIRYSDPNEIFVQNILPSAGFGYRFLCRRNSKRGYYAGESKFALVPGRRSAGAIDALAKKGETLCVRAVRS